MRNLVDLQPGKSHGPTHLHQQDVFDETRWPVFWLSVLTILAKLLPMSTIMQNPFLNVVEAAEVIGCNPSRVRQMLSTGQLEGIKVNERAWMISPESAAKVRDTIAPTGRPRKNSKKRS